MTSTDTVGGREAAGWQIGRVAEVIVALPDGGGRRASGYLVAAGKVLTASHALDGESGVRVRFNADQPEETEYRASVTWRHTRADVALLVFDVSDVFDGTKSQTPAASFGRVGTDGRTGTDGESGKRLSHFACEAVGFPLYKLRHGTFRDSEVVRATCSPHAARREGTLDLKTDSRPSRKADPRPPSDRRTPYEPWEGMSGAVVFSRGRIIGVVTGHHPSDGSGRLTATRIDRLRGLLTGDELRGLELVLGGRSLDPADLTDVLSGRDIRTRVRTRLRTPLEEVWGFLRARPRRVAVAAAGAVGVAVLATVPFLLSGGSGPHPSEGVFGDPRTADPCALMSTGTLARFGDTELDRDYGNWDRCDLVVTAGESSVDVKVDLDKSPRPAWASAARKIGEVGVVEEPADGDSCERTLLPPHDQEFVTVSAEQDGEGSAPLCAMADAAAEKAAEVLDRHRPMPRRSPALPKSSLARFDACDLLDNKALAGIPGVKSVEASEKYGAWDCVRHNAASGFQAKLRFDRPGPPEDARQIRLSGHDAYVSREGEGPGSCVVLVAHRSYGDQHGEPAKEMLHLTVRGPRPPDKLCRMATDLGDSAAAELSAK